MNLHHKIRILILLSAVLCNVPCIAGSPGKPNEKWILDVFSKHMGHLRPEVKHIYDIEFKYKGGYLEGGKYFAFLNSKTHYNYTLSAVKDVIGRKGYKFLKKKYGGDIKKGSYTEQNYEVTFLYTDKGWKLRESTIKFTSEYIHKPNGEYVRLK